jgi:hypothetical protein
MNKYLLLAVVQTGFNICKRQNKFNAVNYSSISILFSAKQKATRKEWLNVAIKNKKQEEPFETLFQLLSML